MRTTIFWVVWFRTIVGSNNELQYEDTLLTKFGIIIHKTNVVVIVDRDSLVIKIVYDTKEIKYFWNNFLEKGDSLLRHIGLHRTARTSREKIRRWSNETLGNDEILESEHRVKRQAALIGGMASLLSLGLTEWQISQVHKRIPDIQTDVGHNEGKIELLNRAVKFNS